MYVRNALLLALACLPAFASPVILNPSFEVGTAPGAYLTVPGGGTDITDWTVLGNSVDYIGSYWQAADGTRSVDLNGNGVGGLQQSIPGFTIGGTYDLFFYMSGNNDGLPVVKNLRVNVSGIGDFDFTFDTTGISHGAMGWQQKTLSFVATSTTHTLSFTSLDSSPATFGAALDNLSLDETLPNPGEVPEPASFALVGLGLGALVLRRKR